LLLENKKVPSNVVVGNFGKKFPKKWLDLEEESYEIAKKIFLENSSFNSSIDRAIYS
jgi:hypothetical protein